MMWLVYVTDSLKVRGKYFLEPDARKKARKLKRENGDIYSVEKLDGMTIEQWRARRLLQK